jgi:hypothetical protein
MKSRVSERNLKRRHLTQSQRATAAAEAKPLIAVEAKKRQEEHGKTAPGRKKPLGLKIGEVSAKSSDQAGKLFGVSGAYVERPKRPKRTRPS